MADKILVSLRAFGRMVGYSEGAVRKAILAKDIVKGVVIIDGSKKIDPELAAGEWQKEILFDDKGKPLPVAAPSPLIVAPDPILSKSKNFDGSEAAPLVDSALGPDENFEDEPEDEGEDDTASDVSVKDFMKTIPDGLSKAQAERLIKVFAARKAQAEYRRTIGELVDKGLVFQNLHAFADVIKSKILNVPDKCIDRLRAAQSRNDALIILSDELSAALRSLANMGSIQLTEGDD